MLSNRSRGTLVSYNDRCAASSRTNEQTNTCAYLHRFDRSHLLTPRLVDYVQYLHVIGQTTLDILGNIEILARVRPVKMALMVTLKLCDRKNVSKCPLLASPVQHVVSFDH